jgi:hypothetical protein
MEDLFLKYQEIYNTATKQNIIFGGSMHAGKSIDGYYLTIAFVGKNGKTLKTEYDITKTFIFDSNKCSPNPNVVNKTIYIGNVFFSNITDDIELIIELS